MSEVPNLDIIIKGCSKNDRESQKQLYKLYYSYAMSICLRYSRNYDDAVEVLNDAFMKVFSNIDKYDTARPFKAWLRVILINASIDHYKKNLKHNKNQELSETQGMTSDFRPDNEIRYEDLMRLVQKLSPVYRAVFNLYVIDGYKHKEIAEMLNINVSTSKANLTKAKANLRKMLKVYEDAAI